MNKPDLTDAEFLNEVRKRLQAALDAGQISPALFEQLLTEATKYLPSRI